MSIGEVIDELYRVRYLNCGPLHWVHTAETPKEMIVGTTSSADWIEWRLLERSNKVSADFVTFEAEIGYTLPHSFKLWHSRYYTLDGDMSIVRLPPIPLHSPFTPLRDEMFEQYLPETLRQKGYLPFGSDGNDTGPICFHTALGSEDSEYAIYVWEHEGDESERYMTLMFSNFRKLLECCVHLHGGRLTNYPTLPDQYEAFAVIDPDGAGKYFGVV